MNAHVHLNNIATHLRAATLDADGCEELAVMLERVASGEDPAAALGVKRGPGQHKLQTRVALDERNRLLREAAARYFPGRSVAEQAQRMFTELSRYRADAWERARTHELCSHSGIQEYFWRALKLHDRALSARTLRLILSWQ